MSTLENSSHISLKEISSLKLHHSGQRFTNPFSHEEHGNLCRLLYWKFFARNHLKKFYELEKPVPISINWGNQPADREVLVTFIKHACFMIREKESNLLIDPLFFGLFPGIQDFTPIVSGLNIMPRPHFVLITHAHFDHLDKPSLKTLPPETRLIVPLGYWRLLRTWGFQHIVELDWFGTFTTGKTTILLLPSNHWTMRNPLLGSNRFLWGSFLIQTQAGLNIYISGDTAYFHGFKEIGQEYRIDLAIFCLGAYRPRWFMANSHISPPQLVKAFKDLHAKKLMIVHWGSFRLSDEPVFFPPEELSSQMQKSGLGDKFIFLPHGNTISFKGS